VVVLGSDVQNRIAKGERGVVAPPASAAPLLTFEDVAFTGTGTAMGRDAVEVFVLGGGLPSMWEKVQVELAYQGTRFPSARNGSRFSVQLTRRQLQALGIVGQSRVQFDFAVAQGSDIRYGAAQAPVQVKLKPGLDTFRIVEPEKMAATDPCKAIFAQLKDRSADYVCLLGTASCMPTDAWLDLKCLVGPDFHESAELTRAIVSAASDGHHPVCDKNGNFGAWIAKDKLRKTTGAEIRFAWSRSNPVWGTAVTAPTPQPAVRMNAGQLQVVTVGSP
jgi:hypothetical protein